MMSKQDFLECLVHASYLSDRISAPCALSNIAQA